LRRHFGLSESREKKHQMPEQHRECH
jgi:hypothetical protein